MVGVAPCPRVLPLSTEFEYSSKAQLRRLKGTMRGSYTLVGQESGTVLEASVDPFALSPPKSAAETKGKGRKGGGDRGRAAKDSAEEKLLNDTLNR